MATWSNKNFRDLQSTNEVQESIVIKDDTIFLNASYIDEDGKISNEIENSAMSVDKESVSLQVVNFKTPNTLIINTDTDTEQESSETNPDGNANSESFIQIRKTPDNDLIIIKG